MTQNTFAQRPTSFQTRNPQITCVTEKLANDILQMSPLSKLLPFKFGRSAIEGMEITCAGCGNEIAANNIRGRIEVIADGHAASVRAYACCYSCRTISPVDAKFCDDGSAIYKTPNGWAHGKWDARPIGFLLKAERFLEKKWRQIVPPAIAFIVVTGWILLRRG